MCRLRPTTCALRDDHAGIHMTARDLNRGVEQHAKELWKDLERLFAEPAQ